MTDSSSADVRDLPTRSVAQPPPVRRASPRHATRWAPQCYLLAIAVTVLLAAASLRRHESGQLVLPFINAPLPPLCYFRSLLGIDCAGCGLTRAFVCLAHGELAAAWDLNPASPLVFGFVVLQIPLQLYQLGRMACGRQPRNFAPWSTAVIIAVLVALQAQWVVRLVLA